MTIFQWNSTIQTKNVGYIRNPITRFLHYFHVSNGHVSAVNNSEYQVVHSLRSLHSTADRQGHRRPVVEKLWKMGRTYKESMTGFVWKKYIYQRYLIKRTMAVLWITDIIQYYFMSVLRCTVVCTEKCVVVSWWCEHGRHQTESSSHQSGSDKASSRDYIDNNLQTSCPIIRGQIRSGRP